MSAYTPTIDSPVPSRKVLRVALWVAQILLAAVFGLAGFMKLTQPIATLAQMLKWPGDVPWELVRFIGTMELLGTVGIILPAATRIMPRLTALAALGFAAIQVLAIPFHISRGEAAMALPLNIPLLALAVFVAWGRYKAAPIAPKT
jgi:uncharacterized membrane protein YphA (DoxX/SURF4 family)